MNVDDNSDKSVSMSPDRSQNSSLNNSTPENGKEKITTPVSKKLTPKQMSKKLESTKKQEERLKMKQVSCCFTAYVTVNLACKHLIIDLFNLSQFLYKIYVGKRKGTRGKTSFEAIRKRQEKRSRSRVKTDIDTIIS